MTSEFEVPGALHLDGVGELDSREVARVLAGERKLGGLVAGSTSEFDLETCASERYGEARAS